MCGRFTFVEVEDLKEIIKRLNIEEKDTDTYTKLLPRYNIAPTQPVPVVIHQGGINRLQLFRWGLVPHWAKDMSIGNKLINARAETLEEKPSFRKPLEQKRCLVLADGFYEWKKEGRSKRPYRITLGGGKPFAFAGLWDSWVSPSGQTINSCTIITTTPNELMEPLHNRMPVILPQEKEAVWLNENTNIKDLKELLVPYPAKHMIAYEVGSLVNSPQNDSPECLAPIARLF